MFRQSVCGAANRLPNSGIPQENRMNTQPRYIYVVLTQTGTVPARMIKWVTKAPYNHASVTCDIELRNIYSFCRISKARPLPAGFVNENDLGVFDMFNTVPCEIYAFEASDEQYENYEALITHFKRKNKYYGYNVLGLFALAFGIPIQRKKRFICSQFVAHVLSECKLAAFEKKLALVKPDDFRYLENARLVYKGDMKKFTYDDVFLPQPQTV
ncbi:MAG: hypothetical protein QM689_07990 [Oscillospiraceae bacterium]